MVEFIKITLLNFLGTQSAVYSLRNAGLMLIVGPNGCGKSTLFEAILWCLWGKTVRGLQYDEVVNERVGKNCCVSLQFSCGGVLYEVTRYRKHEKYSNTLEIYKLSDKDKIDLTQGKSDLTQHIIDTILDIDFDTFTRGPMLPQGSFKRLTQMTDAEIKGIFETALQFESITRAHKLVSENIDKIQLEVSSFQRSYDDVLAKIEKEKIIQEEIKSKIQSWKDQQGVSKAKFALYRLSVYLNIDDCWEKLSIPKFSSQQVKEQLECLADKYDGELLSLADEIAEHKDISRDIWIKLGEVNKEKKRLQSEGKQVNSLKSKRCPTCKQLVSMKYYNSHIQSIDEEVSDLENREEELTQDHLKEVEIVNTLEEQLEKLRSLMTEEKNSFDEKYWDLKKKELDFENFLKRLDDLEDQANKFHALSAHKWTESREGYLSLKLELADSQKKIAAYEYQLDQIKISLNKHEKDKKYLSFWLKGFGNEGIKSMILSTITPFLNKRTQYYSKILTEGQVDVEFSTQRRLKNGNIKEHFQVKVNNKYGSKIFKGNSGGEQARANLIANLAFSDLMSARSKKSFPQKFYDEPFESVDMEGTENIVFLMKKLTPECRSIFVTTHKDDMIALADNVVSLEKDR